MKLKYDKIMSSNIFKDPYKKINDNRLEIDRCVRILGNCIKSKYKETRLMFNEKVSRLDNISPLKTLTRGYCLTEKNGKIVKSKNELKKDDEIELMFFDGNIDAKIM